MKLSLKSNKLSVLMLKIFGSFFAKKLDHFSHHFFYSSAFLWGLLPCVWTNDLAYVRHTSEGARTVRDLGPIYSDLWDPFATVELHLLSVRCCGLLLSCLVSNVEHYITLAPYSYSYCWRWREKDISTPAPSSTPAPEVAVVGKIYIRGKKSTHNGMLCHSLGWSVIFISLQHFILPNLTYCPACKPKVRWIVIRASSQVGQNNLNCSIT